MAAGCENHMPETEEGGSVKFRNALEILQMKYLCVFSLKLAQNAFELKGEIYFPALLACVHVKVENYF